MNPHEVLRSQAPSDTSRERRSLSAATRVAHPRPVIVGSGLAGLTAAWSLDPRNCILVTPDRLTVGAASLWAQGGIAAALADDDSPTLHAQDTLRAGAFAGDRDTVDRITAAAPDVVQLLDQLGVPFDRTADGHLDLALEGGHSRRRVAHAGDHSGATITTALAHVVSHAPHIELLEGHTATRLVTDQSGAVRGIIVQDASGTRREIDTDAVILATGGMGGLFAHTTNPTTALGQGVALAARAGARTDDLHLVQFHPTALDVGRDPMPLLTEALRGAGAVLLADDARFVDELQPRDVVAAAVWEQLTDGRRVRLDARAVLDVRTRFPSVSALAEESGLDIAHDLLPVRPAVHYSMGGVTTDARGRTSVPGLWAIGEVSRTGLHGANRLASNSLLEAVVTGQAAAQDISTRATGRWDTSVPSADPETVAPATTGASLPLERARELLDTACGVLRDGPTLQSAVDQLSAHTAGDGAYVAWLIARSALAHPHSIGGHRRTDDPGALALHGVSA
ncbi:L-aspartate oxidase [Leekyejoonella antrihumi]|uniref:L-aspartate oxidase n=1 Tax=Leekyejoonella antrihumi TaxID=1660198 RepID=A0A563DWC7_9MICO|nr:FAD-binding protein [Leekyejoonella antrihumi]TWP34014.1 FAD-binding protein [Leekyejoonella antrihumi]